MNWLLFYLLVLAYPFLYIHIWRRNRAWSHRFILWGLVTVPAVVYCWDYFAIEMEHERMCKAEGGLKVFIQPEKTDRVRFVGESYGKTTAEGTFQTYFPQARVVEAMTEETGSDGRRLNRFYAYTATPNPKADERGKNFPFKEPDFVMNITPIKVIDPNVYEISKKRSTGPNHSREDVFLMRNGQLYARHTTFIHGWLGIRYPDSNPHWRCPDTNGPGVPPKDDPNAPQEKWIRPPFPTYAIQNLIFN